MFQAVPQSDAIERHNLASFGNTLADIQAQLTSGSCIHLRARHLPAHLLRGNQEGALTTPHVQQFLPTGVRSESTKKSQPTVHTIFRRKTMTIAVVSQLIKWREIFRLR